MRFPSQPFATDGGRAAVDHAASGVTTPFPLPPTLDRLKPEMEPFVQADGAIPSMIK